MPLKKKETKSGVQEKNGKSNPTVAKQSKGSTASTMKMTVSPSMTMAPRLHHRRMLRLGAGKRPGAHRTGAVGGKGRQNIAPTCQIRTPMDTGCDNSDDSGLGFDNPMDIHASLHYTTDAHRQNHWLDDSCSPEFNNKRRKIELKLENDETNDNYCFPETIKNCKDNSSLIRAVPNTNIQSINRVSNHNGNVGKTISRCLPLSRKSAVQNGPVTLSTQLSSASRHGKVHLQILTQPEQQHRARYQTEGSRGAVKDRTGNGFPVVKLIGYDKPTTLQVFIGTDQGRVAPHMFYQACRVSGKNSTPCIEKKIDGTIVIEVELDPTKEMVATCDCVGILKERNVDVEHRFPEQIGSRNKKKSTRCRMVFRTSITTDEGNTEILQVCSQPIVCTQPPGIPEICKKSLTTCPVSGGLELFIIGKNFLKDTQVVFQQVSNNYDGSREPDVIWEECVMPDKEFLQQTHLVCVVPPYVRQDITEPVTVRLYVLSSGKNSEAHNFAYTPINPNTPPVIMDQVPQQQNTEHFLSKMVWNNNNNSSKHDNITLNMMPPRTTLVPIAQRRSSTLIDPINSPVKNLKTELMDENSQNSLMECHMNKFRPINENSQDTNDNSNFHCDKSNDSLSRSPQDRLMGGNIVQNEITNTVPPVPALQNVVAPLQGVDLTLKGQIAINDLADTQPPSMATLLKFGVTENTNMPLPTQTGQSVENFFLTTLENQVNKPILSNSVAKQNGDQVNKMAPLNGNSLENNQQTLNDILQKNVFNDQIASKGEINQLLTPNQKVDTSKIFNNNEIFVSKNDQKELINQLLTTTPAVEPQKMFQNTEFLAPILKNDDSQTKIEVLSILNSANQTETPKMLLNNQGMTEMLQNESQNQILFQNSLKSVAETNSVSPQQSEVIKPDQILQVISNDLLSAKSDPNLLIQNEQIFTPNPTETIKNDILTQGLSLLPATSSEIINSTVLNHPQEIIAPNLTHSEILNPPHPEILLNNSPPLLPQATELVLTSQPEMNLTSNLTSQVPPICQETLISSTLNSMIPQNPLESCLPTQINDKIVANILENGHHQNQAALTLKSLLVSNGNVNATNVNVNVLEKEVNASAQKIEPARQQGCQEMLPPQITSMSENDLIRYINPQCFEGTYTS